jgi:hypothetical protein
MKSRREFLQIGAGSLTLPIAARGAFTSSAVIGKTETTPLYKVVFDERFAASMAFSREVSELEALIHGIKGDMTDLWFHDLYGRWKQGPAAIAGLTAHGPLFCLERLAWDQGGMRVVFRGEHKFLPDGQLEHSLKGPKSMVRLAAGLEAGGEWTRLMANVVTNCPADRAEIIQATIVAPATGHTNHSEDLISWVIAPFRQA